MDSSEGPIRSHYCECIDNVPDIFQAFRAASYHDSVDFSCGISIPMGGSRVSFSRKPVDWALSLRLQFIHLENEGFLTRWPLQFISVILFFC